MMATYRHRLVVRSDEQAMASLAAPIGGQQWTPSADVLSRVRVAGGGER
ncbi:hypothetical protein [Streptomyces kaniharaensis]|nr:hypothetical protein [Streptomyces kaniharaensis]